MDKTLTAGNRIVVTEGVSTVTVSSTALWSAFLTRIEPITRADWAALSPPDPTTVYLFLD